MHLELQATPEEVMRAVEALQGFLTRNRLAERDIFALALALEECGSNIVKHALRGDTQQRFQVTVEHFGQAVRIELRDRGPLFDPTKALPAPSEPGMERPPGGWGIQLVRSHVDDMQYRRENGQNILLLTKQLTPRVA